MPSKKNNRKLGSKKSRSPYKYNRKNNLIRQVLRNKSTSRNKRSKKKKSRSKSRKRYSSSVPRSKKVKSKSPRKLVDINAFQQFKKSPRYSSNDGFQWVGRRRNNVYSGRKYNIISNRRSPSSPSFSSSSTRRR